SEVDVVADTPVADHDIGLSRDQWGNQPGNVVASVLAVGVDVHDDVCVGRECGIEAALECSGQPAIAPMMHDVVDTCSARDHGCAVGATVIDHQQLYGIYPVNVPW